MNNMMVRVGSIRQYEVLDRVIENAICPNCREMYSANLMRSIQKGTIFFIPFIKKTIMYYSTCPYCGLVHKFSNAEYQNLLNSNRANEDLYKICQAKIISQKNKLNENLYRSNKNVAIAILLALFGSNFGLQNWYMGHKKRAILALVMFLVGIALFGITLAMRNTSFIVLVALLTASNCYWGIIDAFRIGLGHAKDSQGKYLKTNRQFKKLLEEKRIYK